MDNDQTHIIDQIRVNVAFEQLIVAVLTGAFVAGILTLVLNLGAAVFGGVLSFSTLLSAALNTLLVSFLVFLVGFLASIIVGAPLFIVLEKAKRRSMWPYLAASLAVAIIVFSFMAGHLPLADDVTVSVFVSVFIPAIVIAFVFGRLMQPHWRAAARAETSKQIAIRLH
jgi:hypothetical protein